MDLGWSQNEVAIPQLTAILFGKMITIMELTGSNDICWYRIVQVDNYQNMKSFLLDQVLMIWAIKFGCVRRKLLGSINIEISDGWLPGRLDRDGGGKSIWHSRVLTHTDSSADMKNPLFIDRFLVKPSAYHIHLSLPEDTVIPHIFMVGRFGWYHFRLE